MLYYAYYFRGPFYLLRTKWHQYIAYISPFLRSEYSTTEVNTPAHNACEKTYYKRQDPCTRREIDPLLKSALQFMKGKKAILLGGSHLLGEGVAEEAHGYILRREEIGAAFTGGTKPEAYFIF